MIRIDERVGNVLLTTPLLAALERGLPNTRIDVLVAASKVRILAGSFGVIPFARKDFFRRPWSFVRQLLALRAARYDVVLDASHWHEFSASSAMLLAWTGAPTRIAHERGLADRYANVLVPPPPSGTSEVDAKLRLLAPLGIGCASSSMVTSLGREGPARRKMEQWIDTEGLSGRSWVALLPGARKLDHRADPSLFAAVGGEARRLGLEVVVVWGPGEAQLAATVARASEGHLAPPTDLDELAALIRLSTAAVANDTGPMHLAVACGAPTIAFFSQDDHLRWGHNSPPNLVIPLALLGPGEALARARAHLVKVLGIGEASH